MSNYNIISNTPKGNTRGEHTIIYQKDGKATHHKVLLYCFGIIEGKPTWAFDSKSKFSVKERKVFLKELDHFQKGASYRKNHPIIKSKADILSEKCYKLDKELEDIKYELAQINRDEREAIREEIKNNLKNLPLTNFINDIQKVVKDIEENYSDRYLVMKSSFRDTHNIYIYSKDLEREVRHITWSENSIIIQNLISDKDIENPHRLEI